MTAIQEDMMNILKQTLEQEFVPHLPPLIDQTRPAVEQVNKNISRAFSGYALRRMCDISATTASEAVVDDFDDYGVDAIYFHPSTEILYLVQAKLKASEQFSQDEALAFCQGIRKLIQQDLSTFNQNVQNRLVDIESAIEDCSAIQLVIAHTGAGISGHAKHAIAELLADGTHGEERFVDQILDYDATRVVSDLRAARAYPRIDTDLRIQKCTTVKEPRETYFGLIPLKDLVDLHQTYGEALYEKNIRSFLGHQTDVNKSIKKTLAENPNEFLYLNNGVTILCEHVDPKASSRHGSKRLVVKGLSVINGAQTIATGAKFLNDNHGADISSAKVSLTVVNAKTETEFGKLVTRARNHQNPVYLADFVALDDEQERLRRDLAYLGYHYQYKPHRRDGVVDPNCISVSDAAQALALFQPDPRYALWLKKEPSRLLDKGSSAYTAVFNNTLTAYKLVNAVIFNRYLQQRMDTEANAAVNVESLAYRHGNFALGWVLAKRVVNELNKAALFDEAKINNQISAEFDNLRQLHWDITQEFIISEPGPPPSYMKGPLALFRNQTDLIQFLQKVIIDNYGLSTDPAIEPLTNQQDPDSLYPQALFNYVISRAPQIGNLL